MQGGNGEIISKQIIYLVRRRDCLGFLDLHRLAVAGQIAIAGLRAESLGAAFSTAVSFT
jgi:hypothetical protein